MAKFIKLKIDEEFENDEIWFNVNHIVHLYDWMSKSGMRTIVKTTDGENYTVEASANEIIHQIRTAV